MLKIKGRTTGRKYPRGDHWQKQKAKAQDRAGERCEVTGEPLFTLRAALDGYGNAYSKHVPRRHVDHVFPERFVRQFLPGADPHILENLLVITPALHGKKWPAERYIYAGNFLSYKAALVRLGYDEGKLREALAALHESIPAVKARTRLAERLTRARP